MGSRISCSGRAKSDSTDAAWADMGVRARRLVGRLERGSEEVGMLSAVPADMAMVDSVWCQVAGV